MVYRFSNLKMSFFFVYFSALFKQGKKEVPKSTIIMKIYDLSLLFLSYYLLLPSYFHLTSLDLPK